VHTASVITVIALKMEAVGISETLSASKELHGPICQKAVAFAASIVSTHLLKINKVCGILGIGYNLK
jgi:hypothetical protein